MYAISRLKAARNAWYWAVHLRRRGALYVKRFYDLKHGGSNNALAAAVAWRNEVCGCLQPLTRREFHEQQRSNNRSGVPGVHFLKTVRQPGGVWQAILKLPNGKRTSKTFSVHKFGSNEAFSRAVGARKQMLDMLDDRPYLNHTTAKRLAPRK
jgi:hypothetical protein